MLYQYKDIRAKIRTLQFRKPISTIFSQFEFGKQIGDKHTLVNFLRTLLNLISRTYSEIPQHIENSREGFHQPPPCNTVAV